MTHSPTPQSPVLRDAVVNTYRPANPITARVVRNDLCTASRKSAGFVRHTEIDVSGTELVGAIQPGQAIGVIAPGTDDNDKPHKVRLYSVCSPSSGEHANPNIIATTVKRTIDEHWSNHHLFLGVCSNHICDLDEGDPITLTGPAGKRFLLPKDLHAHDYMFFATGTGIAPFRGMIIDLLEAGVQNHVTLVMGAPYATDLLYHAFFLEMHEQHPNFTYLTAISREQQEDGHDRLYVQDRLTTNREQLLPQLISERNLIYICGLAGMEVGIFQQIAQALQGAALEQYLTVQGEALHAIRSWNRKSLKEHVRHTGRILLEVYD